MQFSSALRLLLVATAASSVIAVPAGTASTEIDAGDPNFLPGKLFVPGTEIADDDSSEDTSSDDIFSDEFSDNNEAGIPVVGATLNARAVLTRRTNHCSNTAPIKRVKAAYQGRCNPANSRGWRSAHNCRQRGGRSYLCVRGQVAYCYTINDAREENLESGECFIAQ